ncbi:hypothetical protein GCM10025885_07700 [Tetragenococcus osmophilus]|uniref:Transketolase-like C-terminal domain-containing protein n=1 Tax=Tetragenococcus osmophilus TaxID=526944 RepID=A0AA37XKB6_9ENTE|nr:hypothetical protein GCM10025885_07700 [Tetragenococcus osmophilus]
MEAQEQLANDDIDVSVVSLPSFDRFEQQSEAYKESVLPSGVTKRLGIEAGASFGWHKYVKDDGALLTIDRFGASAPGGRVLEEYGFTANNVVSIFKTM